MTYIVKVSSPNNCFAYDTINITVFKTAPDIFVPTVFSPNGDGKNDRLIPVPVGLKGYDFFEIYNRWGQRMFRTTQIGVGWDGYFRGILQDVDTYVWQVQGTDL
jgi:gliding motility-associated-like protein